MGTKRRWVVLCVQNLSVPEDRRVWREARTLADAGYEVAVIGPRGRGQRWREHLDGVVLLRFPVPSGLAGIAGQVAETAAALAGTVFWLGLLLLRGGVRVVHAANPPDTFFLPAAPLRALGTRFVYDQHDLCPELLATRAGAGSLQQRLLDPLLLRLERASYRTADLVIAPNNSYRRVALTRGRCRPESVVVVRNGPDAVVPRPPRRRDARAPMRVAFAGVMGAQDRVDVLLDAVAEVLSRRPGSLVLELVGTGDAAPALRARAEALGIAPAVIWAGWLLSPEYERRLAAADVGVSLDGDDVFSQLSTMTKVAEYIALGLPCVIADLPENRVSAGDAACYFPAGDHMRLAKVLEELVDDPGALEDLRRAAVERAPMLLWAHSAARLVAAYRWLLEGGPPPPGDHELPAVAPGRAAAASRRRR